VPLVPKGTRFSVPPAFANEIAAIGGAKGTEGTDGAFGAQKRSSVPPVDFAQPCGPRAPKRGSTSSMMVPPPSRDATVACALN
jgi:hypothetical protein